MNMNLTFFNNSKFINSFEMVLNFVFLYVLFSLSFLVIRREAYLLFKTKFNYIYNNQNREKMKIDNYFL